MTPRYEAPVVLRAADLIPPERQRCARSEDDQDTRYCRECLKKPCRWFGGWRPVDPETEALIACDDSPSNKTQDHFKTRRKLFEEVDRLIRGRVREVLPVVTLEFKRQIDKDLGLDALRARVARVADGVSKDLDALGRQVETLSRARVEELFQGLEREVADTILAMFLRKAGVLVAKEVGKQIGQLLGKPSEHRVRPKKKKR